MFPSLIVSVSGLDPDATYSIQLNILPADNKRYKFLGSEWVPVGRAEKKHVYRQYTHPDSPNLGSFWMEKTIPFKLVKLTNNKNTVAPDQVSSHTELYTASAKEFMKAHAPYPLHFLHHPLLYILHSPGDPQLNAEVPTLH